jgi:APA family basic amino acid/polyamine antiporter
MSAPLPPALRRSIGLPLLTLYGLGTILGAGIYVLIGEVAAIAGMAAPSAFLVAGILAGTTALCFAELSARLPLSAGEAAYVKAGFGSPVLATATGWSVVIVGTVSAATMVRGFIGYAQIFVDLPAAPIGILAVAGLALVAAWGIGESVRAAAAVTVLEAGGLLFVCFVARDGLARLPAEWASLLPGFETGQVLGVLSGSFVAFYAFIGFEDMVNIAEEVREPTRNLPRAILLALGISTVLYMLVATVASFAVPQAAIAGSDAPLAVIVASRGLPPETIAGISLFAVLNGALIQIIMASRVLYGLASEGLAWRAFARVNRRTQTPLIGTAFVAAVMLVLTLFFSLGGLARVTSFIALGIFALVNAALWQLKRTDPRPLTFVVPAVLPAAGFALCLAMIALEAWRLI